MVSFSHFPYNLRQTLLQMFYQCMIFHALIKKNVQLDLSATISHRKTMHSVLKIVVVLFDKVCGFLSYHDDGSVSVAGHNSRHD